jgi:coenzyme Q-binding protein COQ10
MRNPRFLHSLRLSPSPIAQAPLPSCQSWYPSKSASQLPPHNQSRRHFLPGLAPEIQTLHATRTLPYSSSALYDIVADINSYAAFLPYCLGSSVSQWTPPATPNGKRWPTEAELRVGWGGLDERFVSRVLCIPGSVVEAVSGDTVSRRGLPPTTDQASGTSNGLFTHLLTRWTIRPSPHNSLPREGGAFLVKERTEVNLDINFQFANPIYAALSKAVAPKVAGMMIEAFEERARKLLGTPATRDARPITIEETGDVCGKT